jgi:hypothetical protein
VAEPTHLRYRGDGPDVMANAIVALMRHARETADDFTFGPLRLADLERDGLDVGGPDLGPVMLILASIPGLAITEA